MGPLEFIYFLGYSIKKSRSLRNRKRLPFEVISIGNLTTGGTGKTPTVIAIVEEALKRGYAPCVLTRGYRGTAKGPCFVGGTETALGVDKAGDEAALMANRLKGVPVVKGPDRYKAGLFAIEKLQPSTSGLRPFLFILDDGFQHWKLYRDRDVLLIDGADPFGNGRLLPAGRLREPLSEIERADVVVITLDGTFSTAGAAADGLNSEIRRYNPHAPVFSGVRSPVCLTSVSGTELPLSTISGEKIFAFCGIANPSSFRKILSDLNADVASFEAFEDHHLYRPSDFRRIAAAAGAQDSRWIVTTEKDIIKLKSFQPADNLIALRVEMKIEEGFYESILGRN